MPRDLSFITERFRNPGYFKDALTFHAGLTDNELAKIFDAISKENKNKIWFLEVDQNSLGDESAVKICEFEKLKVLDISKNNFTMKGLKEIINGCLHLRTVTASNTNLASIPFPLLAEDREWLIQQAEKGIKLELQRSGVPRGLLVDLEERCKAARAR